MLEFNGSIGVLSFSVRCVVLDASTSINLVLGYKC